MKVAVTVRATWKLTPSTESTKLSWAKRSAAVAPEPRSRWPRTSPCDVVAVGWSSIVELGREPAAMPYEATATVPLNTPSCGGKANNLRLGGSKKLPGASGPEATGASAKLMVPPVELALKATEAPASIVSPTPPSDPKPSWSDASAGKTAVISWSSTWGDPPALSSLGETLKTPCTPAIVVQSYKKYCETLTHTWSWPFISGAFVRRDGGGIGGRDGRRRGGGCTGEGSAGGDGGASGGGGAVAAAGGFGNGGDSGSGDAGSGGSVGGGASGRGGGGACHKSLARANAATASVISSDTAVASRDTLVVSGWEPAKKSGRMPSTPRMR